MVVGPTGSGKSTLVDIICGLYPSYYNHIKLNSLIYHDINIKKFQSTISYVPQFFFAGKVRRAGFYWKQMRNLVIVMRQNY